MSNEKSSIGILKFAGIVCLVCSLVVSTAAVSLRGIQQRNADNEKKINILRAAGLVDPEKKLSTKAINEKFARIIPLVVNLKTGELDAAKDALTYDMYAQAQSKEGQVLKDDPANIKRIAKDGSAYVLIDNDQITRVILPVQGYGLWSTMYGFTSLSLQEKQPTITGITFYQQGETPGLGARIAEPAWQKQWEGVEPYDESGSVQVDVSKHRNPGMKNQVDAIAGATLTSNGVEHLMNFWLGEQGYKPFLDRLQAGKITIADLRNASQANTRAAQGVKNEQ